MGVLPARRVLDALLPSLDHRRTARGLDDDHARPHRADPAERLELVKRLPHADDAGAAPGRIEDHIGHFPAELLGEFDAHRLLALDAVGLPQGRAVEPSDRFLSLCYQLAAIVDQPIHEVDRRALHRDLADIHRRRVVGAEHRRLDAGAGTIGRHRRAGIAVGRHRHVRDAEFLRHRYGKHQATRLERAGRQAALVLDQQLTAFGETGGDARQRHQWRHHLAERDDVLRPTHRQHLAITPQGLRPRRQRSARQRATDAVEIVAHQKRPAGARQPVQLVGGVALASQAAFEMRDKRLQCAAGPVMIGQPSLLSPLLFRFIAPRTTGHIPCFCSETAAPTLLRRAAENQRGRDAYSEEIVNLRALYHGHLHSLARTTW